MNPGENHIAVGGRERAWAGSAKTGNALALAPSCRLFFAVAILCGLLLWRPAHGVAAEGPVFAVLDVQYVMRRSKAGLSLQSQIDKVRTANQENDRQEDLLPCCSSLHRIECYALSSNVGIVHRVFPGTT